MTDATVQRLVDEAKQALNDEFGMWIEDAEAAYAANGIERITVLDELLVIARGIIGASVPNGILEKKTADMDEDEQKQIGAACAKAIMTRIGGILAPWINKYIDELIEEEMAKYDE